MVKPSRLATWPTLVGLYLLAIVLSNVVNFYVFDWPFLHVHFWYWFSDDLYIAMGFHALFNTQALIVLSPETSGGDRVTDIIALVCGLLLLTLFKSRISREESRLA